MQGQDDGTSCLPVDEYLQTREGEKPLGVYALYDAHNAIQYVGYSRNMVLAVKVCFSPISFAYCTVLHNPDSAMHRAHGTLQTPHCISKAWSLLFPQQLMLRVSEQFA